MKYVRKAMSMPMEIIIALVVLIIIALVVVTFTSGGVTKTGKQTQETQDQSSTGLSCQAKVAAYCATHDAETTRDCTDCCSADVSCGKSVT